jgi:hypothetical protein
MTTQPVTRSTIPDADLPRLLSLIEGSDSVELKVTIPEGYQRSTVAALGMDPLEAEIRQVFFFDTPDLALQERGLVVRARRIQNKRDDSIVKLRPVVPNELPERLRELPDFRIEVDALPGGFVCSATLKRTLDPPAVREAVAGERRFRKLFSKEQRQLYAEHAPDGLEIDDLAMLGPIFVLKLRFTPGELARRLVAEMWLYPDGSRVLELSTRVESRQAFQAAAETRAFFAGRGIEISGEQEAKTNKALRWFAANLLEEQ